MTGSSTTLESIRKSLVGLKMPRALEILDATLRRIEQGELNGVEALDHLLMEELTLRESRRIKAVNRAGSSGGWLAWILRGHRHDLKLRIVGGFRLGRRDAADGLEQAPIVVPIDPFEGGKLDGLERAPGTAPMDHLGLEQADDGFR